MKGSGKAFATKNMLIANFMEAPVKKYKENDIAPDGGVVSFDCAFATIDNKRVEVKNLEYHSDWNWLNKVIDKIESLGYDTRIQKITTTNDGEDVAATFIFEITNFIGDMVSYTKSETGYRTTDDKKIDVVFAGVVDFIKKYKK